MANLTGPQRTAVENFRDSLATKRSETQSLLQSLSTGSPTRAFAQAVVAMESQTMSLILATEEVLRRDADLV